MSTQNQVALQRKQQITNLVDNEQIQSRIVKLFDNNSDKAEKFRATIMNMALDYSLSNCTPQSIVKSALDIAEVGLPLAKSLGQAYIVKYKTDAQAQIGYKGWLAIAERCGKSVKAKPIFSCDFFKMYDNGFDETVEFIPNYDERQDHNVSWVENNLKGVLVALKDHQTDFVTNQFVSFDRIKKIAGMSPTLDGVDEDGNLKRKTSYKTGQLIQAVYDTWNLEMYQAKAIKYVVSKTPMNEQMAQAVELDNKRDTKAIEDKSTKHEPKVSFEDLINDDVNSDEVKLSNEE